MAGVAFDKLEISDFRGLGELGVASYEKTGCVVMSNSMGEEIGRYGKIFVV